MTIRHIVCWKLSALTPRKKADAAAGIVTGLESLVGVVPEIRSLTVGPDVAGNENWDVALIADFDDLEALPEAPRAQKGRCVHSHRGR